MKIFVHVGAHKSASTTIQRNFRQNKTALRQRYGIYFLEHPDLVGSSFYKHFHSRAYLEDGAAGDTLEGLRRSFASVVRRCPEDATVLISAEGFLSHSGLHKYGGLYPHAPRMLEALGPILARHDVSVILITRRQDTFIESCYLQQVKEGRYLTFTDFYAAIDHDRLSWLPIAQAAHRQFGRDRMLVRPFEEIVDGTDAFLRTILGFVTDREIADLKIRQSANPSISQLGVDLALATYPLLQGKVPPSVFKEHRHYLFREFSSAKYPKAVLLDSEARNAILARCRDDNETLFRDYIPDLRPDTYSGQAG